MKYLNFANNVSDNNRPEILISLIDLSPSMDYRDYKPSRKAGALNANKELLKVKLQQSPNDQMGIIGFARKAKLLNPPVKISSGFEDLLMALNNPMDSFGTNFNDALKLASDYLFNKQRPFSKKSLMSRMLSELFIENEDEYDQNGSDNDNVLRRIIMLTDGEYNQGGCPITTASKLKKSGVIIDCIGIGGSPDDVDEATLKQIASRNPDGSIRYCFIGDQQQLIQKYQTLAKYIRVL